MSGRVSTGLGSCLLWPFLAAWRIATFVFEITGRLLALVLGLILMAAGVLLSLTVLGAILGIPLAVFGFLLLMRGLF